MVAGIIGIVDPDSIDPGEGPLMFLAIFGPMGLATAIVQVAYLGHGDQGLVANIGVALPFAVVGGIVSAVWLAIARRWSHGGPSVPAAA